MEWIDEIIMGLIDMYGTNDIYEIYDCLDIRIVKLDKNNITLRNNDAFYYRNYLGNEIVFIRNDLLPPFEKFILAHELGHALLHTRVLTAAFNKDLINVGKLERQANYFALKLENIMFDEVELREMTLEQIASSLELPYKPLKQLVNM